MLRLLFMLLISCAAPETAPGQTRISCGESEVTVAAGDIDEAESACEIVLRADIWLRQLGLTLKDSLSVEITDELSFAVDYCAANYDADLRRIQILSVECLEESPPSESAFPNMPADILFMSLLYHELTHAYTHSSLDGRPLPRAAHEYLAYSVQLDSLPEDIRERLLKETGVLPPVSISELNEMMLFMAPKRFAAKSWTFFKQNGGGAEAVSRVLTGKDKFPRLLD